VVQCIRSPSFFASCVIVCVFGSLPARVCAETDHERIERLERQLAESNQLIERLLARVGQLEHSAGAGAQQSPATHLENAEQSVSAAVKDDNAPAARPVPTQDGITLHAFADVGHVNSDETLSDERDSGFTMGNLDFYLTPQIGTRVRALFELNFEYDSSGELEVDLERAQIGYTVDDSLTLWAGRFHTPFGYWNTTFHHGAQLQTSVARPRFLEFEDAGGILPTHTVGLWASGTVRTGGGRLYYDAYVGNGDRIVDGTLDFNAVHDDDGEVAFGASVGYQFGLTPGGLLLGLHALRQGTNIYSGSSITGRSRLRVYGGYAVYQPANWEAIAEYYRFANDDLSAQGARHTSWSGFIQLGHVFVGHITPYVRYEEAVLDQDDPYFASLAEGRSYTRGILGMRFDLNPKAALKLEVNRTDETRDGGQRFHELLGQLALRF
jgi:hypothetical protein